MRDDPYWISKKNSLELIELSGKSSYLFYFQKYFLLPVFFILLAMLVSFAFGIIGSNPTPNSEPSDSQ